MTQNAQVSDSKIEFNESALSAKGYAYQQDKSPTPVQQDKRPTSVQQDKSPTSVQQDKSPTSVHLEERNNGHSHDDN